MDDCPKCGARPMVVHDITGEQIPWPAWECGTQNHHDDFRQSDTCKIKEQQATVEQLKEDIAEGIAKNERLLNETIEQQATIKKLETKLKALAGAEQHLERVPHIRQNEDDGWCWKDERLAGELAEAVEYATRLFKTVAPQCEPLPNISGLLTQLDNYIAGAKKA